MKRQAIFSWKLFSVAPKSTRTVSTISIQQNSRRERNGNSGNNNKRRANKSRQSATAGPTEYEDNHWLPTVVLKRNHQSKSFRNGNQLVFSGAIQKEPKSLKLGQLVQLKVEQDLDIKTSTGAPAPMVLLGWGVYNPLSLYRVRFLGHRYLMSTQEYQKLLNTIQEQENSNEKTRNDEKQQKVFSALLEYQLSRAVSTRMAMQLRLGMGNKHEHGGEFTDTFRLVNGEGDTLSGLAIDVIGGHTGVVMSSAGWCEVHKETILKSLEKMMASEQGQEGSMDWIWKTTPGRLEQDGYKPTIPTTTTENNDNHETMVLSWENGIQYLTFPYRDGQKTSVYCDQRENRRYLASRQYCQDKRVLDLCCYHGGFSLNAVIHGAARHVTGVDSSQDAIDACWENVQRNRVILSKNANHNKDDDDTKFDFVRSDITDFLLQAWQKETFYDVIILDPPKLAPSTNALEKARQKYHSLNRDACKVIDPVKGGLLMTCTCSAAMTQKDGGQYFLSMVQGAAQAAGRDVTLLRVSGAAPCHTQSPVSWPAGAYLTAALFRVHPSESS